MYGKNCVNPFTALVKVKVGEEIVIPNFKAQLFQILANFDYRKFYFVRLGKGFRTIILSVLAKECLSIGIITM